MRYKIASTIAMFGMLLGFQVVIAPLANADDTVTITAKVVGVAVADAQGTVVGEASGSSYAFAAAQVRSKAKVNRNKCFWSSGTNSYYAGGKLHSYYDPVPAYVCKLKHPVHAAGKTWTYKKLKGGTSGSACGNLFIPGHQQVSYTRAVVLDVRSGTIAKVIVWARVCVDVKVNVLVTLEYTYNGETHRVTKMQSGSDSDCDADHQVAMKKVTKKTRKSVTANEIARVKARAVSAASAKARAKATAKAQARAVAEVDVTIHVTPENKPPTGEIVKYPMHLYQGGTFMVEVVGSDPEDGANVSLTYTVTGGAKKLVDVDHPEHCDAEGVNQVCTFYIEGVTPGQDGTVSLVVTDSKGLTYPESHTFPVLTPEL